MPLYEYACPNCGEGFELIQKFSDPPEAICPSCGQPAERQLSAPAIQFKGSGWYVTDYARKQAPSDGKGESKPDAGTKEAATKGSSQAETKGETKAKDSSDGSKAPG